MPMMPFIGVRISWLTFARNALFERLAASAASVARISASRDARASVTSCMEPARRIGMPAPLRSASPRMRIQR